MCPHCVRPWIQKDRTPQGVPSRRRDIYLVSLIIGKNGDNYRCLHLCSGKRHNCSIFLIKVVISAGCKVMIKWKWILLTSRWGVGRNVLRTTLCRELQLFSNSISIISLWSRHYPHFTGEENRARLKLRTVCLTPKLTLSLLHCVATVKSSFVLLRKHGHTPCPYSPESWTDLPWVSPSDLERNPFHFCLEFYCSFSSCLCLPLMIK